MTIEIVMLEKKKSVLKKKNKIVRIYLLHLTTVRGIALSAIGLAPCTTVLTNLL